VFSVPRMPKKIELESDRSIRRVIQNVIDKKKVDRITNSKYLRTEELLEKQLQKQTSSGYIGWQRKKAVSSRRKPLLIIEDLQPQRQTKNGLLSKANLDSIDYQRKGLRSTMN